MRELKVLHRDNENRTIFEEVIMGEVNPEMLQSPDVQVRAALAYRGYGLDVLINDPSPLVRRNVAIHFYGLDILVNDPDPEVADIAKRKMEQLNNDRI